LGGIFGGLENPKSKPTLEIGLWKIDGFEKVGRTISQSINMPQALGTTPALFLFNHHAQNQT
jgi:hypothetical protein